MSKVLLATDGSDIATKAIAEGVEMLGHDHEYLALAVTPHAYAPAASITPMDTHPVVIDPSLENEIEAHDREELSHELEKLNELLHIEPTPLVVTGDPGPTIVEVAKQRDVDIIILGSHGHGWLQRVLLGSVSTHVLHHAPCAVMVMRTSHN